MKRILTIFAVVALVTGVSVGVALAWGPGGFGAGANAPGTRGGGYGMMGGRMGAGQMGSRMGAGQMGGRMGAGQMGGRMGGMMNANPAFDFELCDGENYDPAAMLTRAEQMLAQHQSVLTNLQAQLAAVTDEAQKTWITARIELQKIMIAWSEGRIPAIKSLPAGDWVKGATTMAQYDVDYFSNATATDANNKSFIANRVTFAQQRLEALKAEAAK